MAHTKITRPTSHSKRAPRRRKRSWGRWLTTLVVAVASLMLIAGAAAAVLVYFVHSTLPDVSALYQPPSQATRIFAANGELIASLFQENREFVPLREVPDVLRQAVIAIEDERFALHRGIDLRGMMRAVWVNVSRGSLLEGGSTITQQLARNLFLSPRQTVDRKLQEILLAIEIERRLTKDEILERYLNQVYLGNGAYGVQMASRVYFGKHVRDLTLPEAAMIAGIIQAPSRLAPFDNFEGARRRQEVVLRQMADVGIISRSQAEKAMRAKVELRADRTPTGMTGIRAPYFVSYLIPFLSQRYGEDQLYKGGLQIHTTLEPQLQQLAQSVVTKGVAAAQRAGLRLSQGAVVAIDPRTGYIKAMVGGVDYRASQFNRAWQARRQPGSAFKPFIYVTALGKGIAPERILDDRPVEYRIAGSGTWKPQNYDRQYVGPISLRRAVELSRNVPVIRLLEEIGAQDAIATAQRMGIRSPLQPNLSLALGTSEVTPLEMASAYGTLAAGGVHAQPIAVTRVLDAQGRVLEEVSAQRKIAVSPEAAYVMTDILRGVVLRGTGTAANIGRPVAGKTGTTDDYRNAWFVGYTPTLSTAVWVGNDDNRPMNRVTGGSTPARLWAEFARGAIGIQKTPPLDFARPDNVVVFSVCVKQGEDGTCERYQTRARVRDDAALGSFAGRGGQSGSEVPGNGPAALRPVFLRPLPGAVMPSPFVVEGRVAPGARVRMRVVMEGGAVPTDVAETEVPVGPDGGFGYHFETALKFPGARYVITASATHPDGTLTSATITIVER